MLNGPRHFDQLSILLPYQFVTMPLGLVGSVPFVSPFIRPEDLSIARREQCVYRSARDELPAHDGAEDEVDDQQQDPEGPEL